METARRLIHIGGVSTIVLAELLGKAGISIVVFSATILYLASEYLRLHEKRLPVITRITRFAARENETSGLILSPVSYAMGILISMNLFPQPLNYAAISILTIGDGFSSLVGKRFGRHVMPYNRTKTVEGSTAFFICSLISTLIFVNPSTAILGSIVGTVMESLPTRYWENVLVPTTSGLSMNLLLLIK